MDNNHRKQGEDPLEKLVKDGLTYLGSNMLADVIVGKEKGLVNDLMRFGVSSALTSAAKDFLDNNTKSSDEIAEKPSPASQPSSSGTEALKWGIGIGAGAFILGAGAALLAATALSEETRPNAYSHARNGQQSSRSSVHITEVDDSDDDEGACKSKQAPKQLEWPF